VLACSTQFIIEQRREDQDRTLYASGAKLGTFIHGSDTVSPRVDGLECPRHRYRAKPVRVGLDHGEQRHARSAREC
jgi:hypothetical protein